MLIHIQLGQGANVDLKFTVLRKFLGHRVIQAVDALDDENILLSKLQHFAFVFPLTGLKVKPWKFDGLTGEAVFNPAFFLPLE